MCEFSETQKRAYVLNTSGTQYSIWKSLETCHLSATLLKNSHNCDPLQPSVKPSIPIEIHHRSFEMQRFLLRKSPAFLHVPRKRRQWFPLAVREEQREEGRTTADARPVKQPSFSISCLLHGESEGPRSESKSDRGRLIVFPRLRPLSRPL